MVSSWKILSQWTQTIVRCLEAEKTHPIQLADIHCLLSIKESMSHLLQECLTWKEKSQQLHCPLRHLLAEHHQSFRRRPTSSNTSPLRLTNWHLVGNPECNCFCQHQHHWHSSVWGWNWFQNSWARILSWDQLETLPGWLRTGQQRSKAGCIKVIFFFCQKNLLVTQTMTLAKMLALLGWLIGEAFEVGCCGIFCTLGRIHVQEA